MSLTMPRPRPQRYRSANPLTGRTAARGAARSCLGPLAQKAEAASCRILHMRRNWAIAGIALLALAGCSGEADDAPAEEAAAVDLPASIAAAFEAHDLTGLQGKELVDHLDRLGGADRPTEFTASVRADGLVVSDGVEEASLPLPADEFYLSVAPYVQQSHECYFHSLTTCQGELTGEDLDVRIVADDGEVLVDETATTYENGFVGYWLPRDVEGSIEISYDGRTGTVPIATDAESPTCLTTVQLT